MEMRIIRINRKTVPIYSLNTVVVGTGAASLSCADHIYNLGQTDIALVTEKIGGGTSNNTGSDKQTYYKLSLYGKEGDSPHAMAQSLFDGGSMHGDLALIESLLSPHAFFRLVHIGVPFPQDKLGGYVGYKTDNDPRQRATSAGPWTSSQMVSCLLKEVKRKSITIFDEHEVIALLKCGKRICGLVSLDKKRLNEPGYGLTLFQAENVVFGVGGPGGIYKTSVYPEIHTGAIGLALEIGAKAVNLMESQYGLASIGFRWNVSGTYQQVIPRYISTDKDGNDERDFLKEHFPSMGKLATSIFLKGYQWPFDTARIRDYGSSLIDILVYIETVIKGRRVFMDFRENPRGKEGSAPFSFDCLEKEARTYLEKSQALFGRPIDRLQKMNPQAVQLYREHGIDLETEPLEVAVCAQHNNGGLMGDIWWESNVRHLFPVGEVNGSHGVHRPGGAALNSGQVGALRAAQRIAYVYNTNTVNRNEFEAVAVTRCNELFNILDRLADNTNGKSDILTYRENFQKRMTDAGSHIREKERIKKALEAAYQHWGAFAGMEIASKAELPDAMKNKHLVFSHIAYLEAIHSYLEAGGGSRGSSLVLDDTGLPVLEGLPVDWKYKPEDASFRKLMLETHWNAEEGRYVNRFTQRRPIPVEEDWFENVWEDFQTKKVFMGSDEEQN